MQALRQDQTRSFRGWCRVKEAARVADRVGVTDRDLLEAARDTRITIAEVREADGTTRFGVHYTAGQYFPTEFRHAVALVIETATNRRLTILRVTHAEAAKV
jgi:hypothetical protein